MASNIDATKPETGNATTSSVRDNFSAAKTEIEALQAQVGGDNLPAHIADTEAHGVTGAIVGTTNTQTLTNKTLTSPTINGTVATTGLTMPAFTLGGTVTSNGQSFSGTIADLGTVTTMDLNGGTIDGTPIGATTPASGTFTTLATSSISLTGSTLTGPANEVIRFKDDTADAVAYIAVESQFGVARFGTFNNYPAILYDATNYAYYYDSNNLISYLAGNVYLANAAGPALMNEAASNTNPTVLHDKSAPTYGLGGTSTETSLIGGGNEVVTAGNNTLSFFAAAPVAKQTITGSRGSNAALADLLTKLATIGLITDSTS